MDQSNNQQKNNESESIGKFVTLFIDSLTTCRLILLENPNPRIQFLLGDDDQTEQDFDKKSHALFVELNELATENVKHHDGTESAQQGWKETGR